MTPTMTLTTEVLHRAAHLRRSKNDVRNRRKLQPYQQEQYELFNSTYCRFKLTDSALWQQVIADAATHPRTIGLTSPDAGCARRSESAARSPGVPIVRRGRGLKGWVSLRLARSRLFSSQLPHCVCVERH